MFAGDEDIKRAAEELAATLPVPLRPLARIAYNYWWSWSGDGASLFESVDPQRWPRIDCNPVRQLSETPRARLESLASDPGFVDRVIGLAARFDAELSGPASNWADINSPAEPIAFFCAEFGVHGSLPIYSGGLGILAGDILKQASDAALPMVGVGLMYRTGYFHQRIDLNGYQHEYWLDADPERLPCTLVTGIDQKPLTVQVPVDDEDVTAQIWRVDIGRVPLYLLDTDLESNSEVGRWITSRLYESNRAIRLAQYAVLGVGGVRALRAMRITPGVYHLNEGHPALGVFELLADEMASGMNYEAAWQRMREKVVFTTHTPVPAGNETYGREEVLRMLGRIASQSGDPERFLGLGRMNPADSNQGSGLTPLAMRASRRINGVSRRHEQVARAMWQELFGIARQEDVPITHVTNGVHVPTWLTGPMRALLDKYLGAHWMQRADEPSTWAPVASIPSAELWATRCAMRKILVDLVTRQSTSDRLRRGEPLDYAGAAIHGFDPERLTIGFARRLATYKRLHLIAMMPERALALIGGPRPVQFVFAGKAHPADSEAKQVVSQLFALKRAPDVAGRAAFLEDYGILLAGQLVAGCDVWVNLPRPPNEASGTSGMKSCLGGGLQLSVLDGWWVEGYDGSNGWAINGEVNEDHHAQDLRDASSLFDLLEREVVPMFHERDNDGVPLRWVAMIRRSLMTNGPRFSAARMLREYTQRIYRRN